MGVPANQTAVPLSAGSPARFEIGIRHRGRPASSGALPGGRPDHAPFFPPCALAATLGKPCRCILKGPLGARNGEAELGTTPD
jgi:hypothetical protein